MKICTKCKINKPYTEFSKSKISKDGYQYKCKECEKQYKIGNIDKIRQYRRKYWTDNKDKIKEYKKQYYLNNTDKIKEYKLRTADKIKYYKLINADKIEQVNKQYYIKNADKKRLQNKEYRQTEHGRLYMKASGHRRRASLRGNTPSGKHFTMNDIILKLKLQKDKCVYCQTSIKNYYQIDHIIPASKGGSNMASNIQLLCKECNGAGGKWDKMPHEFAEKHGMLF